MSNPKPGFIRVSSHALVGRDGHFIVWENDQVHMHMVDRDGSTIRDAYDGWMRAAKRVDFFVDIPIEDTEVEGEVIP